MKVAFLVIEYDMHPEGGGSLVIYASFTKEKALALCKEKSPDNTVRHPLYTYGVQPIEIED